MVNELKKSSEKFKAHLLLSAALFSAESALALNGVGASEEIIVQTQGFRAPQLNIPAPDLPQNPAGPSWP